MRLPWQLLKVIGQLEFQRLRTRLFGLLLVLLGIAAGMSCTPTTSHEFKITTHYENHNGVVTNHQQQALAIPEAYQSLWQALPAFGALAIGLGVGILVLLTLPVRSREDWQSGTFQMFLLSDQGIARIEAWRFGFLVLVALGFLALVQVLGTWYLWRDGNMALETVVKGHLILAFWYVSMVPLLLAVVAVVSAANMAYYSSSDDGQGTGIGTPRLFSWVKLVGFLALVSWYLRGVSAVAQNPEGLLLPPVVVSFGNALAATEVSLAPLWVPASWLLTAGFVYTSGLIYRRIEV